jgi:glycosyltransferase involved in cell wall biosynthesis
LAQDDADFRRELSLFLEDRDTRRRYSEAAQAWSETFSWDSCARQTLAILLAAGSAGATIREKTAPELAPQ